MKILSHLQGQANVHMLCVSSDDYGTCYETRKET